MKRRKFLRSSAAIITCPILAKANTSWKTQFNNLSGEKYWQKIADEFIINQSKNGVLNFNSGSAGTITKTSYDQLCAYIKLYNETSFYSADKKFEEKRNSIKEQLANLLDSQANEIALVRNTTEAINNVITGYPFKEGDEVIVTDHDYPFVLNTLNKLKRNKGIHINKLSFDLINKTNEEIIDIYKSQISKRTKLLILSHISFREGRILPVKQLTKLAHENKAEVLIDGAHSFAQINFSLKDINCDYYASSLHKWLCAPPGNGLLFIKQQYIDKINPTNNAYIDTKNKMQKFEQVGTYGFYNKLGIDSALQFHQLIGIDKKQERLFELTKYLQKKVSKIKGVEFLSNINSSNYCAISNITFKSKDHSILVKELESKFNIIIKRVSLEYKPDPIVSVKTIKTPALRVSTNIFLTKNDIDTFCSAIKSII